MKRVSNPQNPYRLYSEEFLGIPPEAELQIYEEQARSILSENKSPDIPFRWSINPYRGCFHACSYCYARPTHHYLDHGSGTDFETKLTVKINAAELLSKKLQSASWKREMIFFSGITDCYQPLEAIYELTRRCLERCLHHHTPVSIITKGALIRRDIDLLSKLHKRAGVQVHMSIAFSDDTIARRLEPSAPSPSIRFKAMKSLSDAGIPVGLALAPVIPGINDRMIPEVVKRASDHGATHAFLTLLRLPGTLKESFPILLEDRFPRESQKVISQLRRMKDGALNRQEFGKRMTGSGPQWQAIQWLFEKQCSAYGIQCFEERTLDSISVTKENKEEQLSLFF